MNRKRVSSSFGFLKTGIISLVVLAFFVFPAVVGFSWMKGVIASRDSRNVYDLAKISHDCTVIDNANENIEPFKDPLLTITFDDGWETAYSNALPVMEQNCINSTQYILGDHFHEKKYLSENQALSFQEFGHEIASHTMTHPDLTTLSSDNLFWELNQSKLLLSSKFGNIKDFASPLGAYNPDIIGQIKDNYRSHRNTAGDPAEVGEEDVNLIDNFDKYNIIAYTVRGNTPDEYITNLIKYAQEKKGWAVLVYHQIDYSDSEYAVTPEAFSRQMKLISDSKIKTPIMGNVLDILEVERGNQ